MNLNDDKFVTLTLCSFLACQYKIPNAFVKLLLYSNKHWRQIIETDRANLSVCMIFLLWSFKRA